MTNYKTKDIVDFIIVGSMKAGTTSLHHWLRYSDQVSMLNGESHFFNHSEHFEKAQVEYEKRLPLKKSGFLVGDDTPTYSYLPEVPERIYRTVPNVKLLWILRDPLERALSQFWHAARKGAEVRSVTEAFSEELQGDWPDIWKRYLYRSFYREQIERYLHYFSREQMHFINFHSFKENDEDVKRGITNFLGLSQISRKVPHSNQTSFYPRPSVNKLLSLSPMPSKANQIIRMALGYQKARIPSLSHELQSRAVELLKEENQGIEEIIGFSLNNLGSTEETLTYNT